MQPGDVIIFNATWVQIPFEYYFRSYDREVELRGMPVDLFDLGTLEPKMTRAYVPALQELVRGKEGVWLVYSHDWYTDPEQIVMDTLGQERTEVAQEEFLGLRVLRFE